MAGELAGRKAMVLGAETELGAALVQALAQAGTDVAAVAATIRPDDAFAAKRAARRAAAAGVRAEALAIDATNEAALRVTVRQVGKLLGGLQLAFVCGGDSAVFQRACRLAGREIARSGGGAVVGIGEALQAPEGRPAGVRWLTLAPRESIGETVEAALSLAADREETRS
ncbi:MAG TPA: hypothetical protein VFB90_01040 [Dehalococcoidia bacterium]|nr:hypothetical protein [Dehalococcoidia bacterium]